MEERAARNIVRGLVSIALLAAFLGSGLTPTPDDLPAVALGQKGLYRLEIALAVFYGSLLLITPVFSAITWGRLPIEISTRGARFAEGASQSAKRNEADIKRVEGSVGNLADALADLNTEIKELKQPISSDNT